MWTKFIFTMNSLDGCQDNVKVQHSFVDLAWDFYNKIFPKSNKEWRTDLYILNSFIVIELVIAHLWLPSVLYLIVYSSIITSLQNLKTKTKNKKTRKMRILLLKRNTLIFFSIWYNQKGYVMFGAAVKLPPLNSKVTCSNPTQFSIK